MKESNKEERLSIFAPLYILKKLYGKEGLNSPENYKNDKAFLSELEKYKNQDTNLLEEIRNASMDTSNDVWKKVDEIMSSPVSAKSGGKLKYLQSLKKGKKMQVKKCKCGCDMIMSKEDGGKIVNKCSCGCGGGKIRKKEKGGILDKYDLDSLLGSGTLESSTINKWERKIRSNKIGKFKK